MTYSNELLYHAAQESNRIEWEPIKGQSFDNLWRCTLLARTASEENTLLHPRAYHQLLFEGLHIDHPILKLEAGEYRPLGVNVYVRGQDGKVHAFADSDKVPGLMDAWWAKAENALLFGSPNLRKEYTSWNFHAWFEAIHPFPDGNGRVGRLLWWNMAMIARQDIEVVTFDERLDYYDRLEYWWHNYSNVPQMNPFRR